VKFEGTSDLENPGFIYADESCATVTINALMPSNRAGHVAGTHIVYLYMYTYLHKFSSIHAYVCHIHKALVPMLHEYDKSFIQMCAIAHELFTHLYRKNGLKGGGLCVPYDAVMSHLYVS